MVNRFQLFWLKFPRLQIVLTAGKNLTSPDTLSRNPLDLLTRKITVEIPQNIKMFLANTKNHHF